MYSRYVVLSEALRLARYFNSTPQFWLNLQTSYDLKTAQFGSGPKIEREVLPSDDADVVERKLPSIV